MPPKRSSSKVMHRAGELRREPTPAEKKLWAYLRRNNLNGVRFRRHEVLAFAQGHAIGQFIADFPPAGTVCSVKHKLVIELDGSHHLEQQRDDQQRSQYLQSRGYTVLRFWNKDVIGGIDDVLQAIMEKIESLRSEK